MNGSASAVDMREARRASRVGERLGGHGARMARVPAGRGDERIERGRERGQHGLDRLVVLQRDDAHARAALAEDPVELAHERLHALGVVRAVEQDQRLPGDQLEPAGRDGSRRARPSRARDRARRGASHSSARRSASAASSRR